jgi:hypothetical protein
MKEEDKLFYDEQELGRDTDAFMADETLLKKFRATFGSGDGLDVFEYIVDRLCTAFNLDITGDKEAARQEVGLALWEMAMKADVEICIKLMRRWALKYQTEKLRNLNEMQEDHK